MEQYFNIRYEFDRTAVHNRIAERLTHPGSDYICVADGVILDTVNRDESYRKVVDSGMFSICDSSYVPLYIKLIYGREREQYCGSEIFRDIVKSRRYRMAFLGTRQPLLEGLRANLMTWNPDVATMRFEELPFLDVDSFDYPAIARMIEEDGAEIIWVALGAPKQEQFMHRLQPHLKHGVMIAVGAAFKFYSDQGETRAPEWMLKMHLEFAHRLSQEPKKQFKRCCGIVKSLPRLLYAETRRKRQSRQQR